MAEGNNENISPDNTRNRNNRTNQDESDVEESVIPDLGVENIRGVDRKTQSAEVQSSSCMGASETPKREENPFSFKHFLKRDSTNYQHQGARPKVYTSAQPSLDLSHGIAAENHQPRMAPEFSSALPDFVQDHLVIEQCYLGNDASPQELSVALDNLPDFAPNRNGTSRWKDPSRSNERRATNTPTNLPLDLPGRPRVGFPLDLPLTESQANCSRNCTQPAEVGVSKSLPDFLSDGAVYSQPEDSSAAGQSPEREVDRLRREAEQYRRQLAEQSRRADLLQRHLDASRDKEQEYTKALEKLEENLNVSNRRALAAENLLVKLKQEIKQLSNEVSQLQKENRALRGEEGATGGPSYVPNYGSQAQRFAQDLRSAANNAEYSLRQLLSGVHNLRVMASSLESMNRVDERAEPYLSDMDEDSGPAL